MLEVGHLLSKPFRIIAAAEPDKRKGNNIPRGQALKNERNRAWRRFKNKVTKGIRQEEMVKAVKVLISLRRNGR